MSWQELISDADISIGFVKGSGLGAVLLALVIIVYLLRRRPNEKGIATLLSSLAPKAILNRKQVGDETHKAIENKPENYQKPAE